MNKIKGTHDLIFPELDKWIIIENKIKKYLAKYNFQEIRTPIIEYLEVFQRSAQYSEMVLKEIFQFIDKKNRKIALRPEGTASIVRSYVENKLYHDNELKKFYYYGPFFRYERPQKGRYRQFHQIGFEVIGIQNFLSEIEIFILINDLLDELNLKAKIIINSLGDLESRNRFLKNFRPYIIQNTNQLCNLCLKRIKTNILRIFDCKECAFKKFLKEAPVIFDYLTQESKYKFQTILDILQKAQINFEVDFQLVRGLDYYTDIIFEISYFSLEQKQNLILGGGGNYNELIKEFSGHKINSIGCAFGMERLMLVLEENLFFQNYPKKCLDVYVFVLDDILMLDAVFLLRLIRKNNIKSEMNYKIFNFKKQFSKILYLEPKYIIFIGKKEMEKNKVTIKNVLTHQNTDINKSKIIHFLKERLFA
ncbi:MAG: histidine--tRNA ligase [Phytoplasma sp.]|uniref:histidine--tRNA ligase n=1 Tax=Phytoplasma sp. TaxID=2155 RepID=UPI002B40960E|nr:histidine--tRNA ligase [Phytoplasma sp.]WRH06789.1 MAG: histidine--tRNA ligase [Phytoplasma sp.]